MQVPAERGYVVGGFGCVFYSLFASFSCSSEAKQPLVPVCSHGTRTNCFVPQIVVSEVKLV